jgi:hypothetical protein
LRASLNNTEGRAWVGPYRWKRSAVMSVARLPRGHDIWLGGGRDWILTAVTEPGRSWYWYVEHTSYGDRRGTDGCALTLFQAIVAASTWADFQATLADFRELHTRAGKPSETG